MILNQQRAATMVVSGEEARKKLLSGVEQLFEPVASTLGASGRTVILENRENNPQPTKDGVTVAKEIELFDPVERMGCEIIKQASLKTAEDAGDGTTTSTVLARHIINKGIEVMKDKGMNYTDFTKGMNLAVDAICTQLDKDATKVTLSSVTDVATISANNDEVLGKIIGDAFKKAGKNGVVIMDESDTSDTFITLTEGFELEKGYVNEVFVNDKEKGKCEFEDALVLISNLRIERLSQIEHLIEYALMNNRPMIIVGEVEEDVLATLAVNKQKGVFKCCVVEPSHLGVRRREVLTDLAISTSATIIDDHTGDNFENVTFDALGSVGLVTSSKTSTVFINKTNAETKEHIELLKKQIKSSKSKGQIEWLEERIAKISSSVAVVNVGASSTTEQSEKADRVDDAINATRAALSEGIVAGGGSALKNCYFSINAPVNIKGNTAVLAGWNCVFECILEPMKRILLNADIDFESVDSEYKKHNFGMNVKTREVGDMIYMKIIDPVKVTKTALKNAVSSASTLLSTTSVIVKVRK